MIDTRWKKIATRYVNCPEVLGYDLFNAPITNDGTGEAYEALLSQTIEAIRLVDRNHLIVVSILYVIRGCIEEHETIEQFRLVGDEKVLYDSHFYDPASTTPFMLVRLATITGTFNQRLWD